MEFDRVHRKSIIVKPSDPEGVFIMEFIKLQEKSYYRQHILGNRALITMIDPGDLAEFSTGNLENLSKYVSQGPEPKNKITFQNHGHLTLLPNSVVPRVPLKDGDSVFEFSPAKL